METETTAEVIALPVRISLDAYSTDALIQAVIQLTHCTHTADSQGDTGRADEYRERREVAIRELKRRTGDL
jgi:hypothetical protein